MGAQMEGEQSSYEATVSSKQKQGALEEGWGLF